MPELPEVEIVRRGLAPHVVGRRIARLVIRAPRLTRRQGNPETLAAAVAGCGVGALSRRGKWLLFDLGTQVLVVRLGMTGQLLWDETSSLGQCDAHTHAEMTFHEGGRIRYRDVRKFGEFFLLPAAEVESRLGVGPEPLEDAFTEEALAEICRGSRVRIKALLLDQRKIAGIGNIYADEALFRAEIRPTRRADALRAVEVRRLRRSIRLVLREALRYRGSTISDYRDPYGNPGGFAPRHRVYQRHGLPCRTCGTPIRRILVAQRGTHFCPSCQR
jgi:formamidopyrimidine-DNA glycosylase